ncbi:MAG: hypothetical protein ABIJ97_03700 [Bacteroidota bacterium]
MKLFINFSADRISRSLFFILVFSIGVLSLSFSQDNPGYKSYFGFSLNTGVSDATETFGIVRISDDGDMEFNIISRFNWILQAYGVQESEANTDSTNYFEKYNLEVKILGELWKIRYGEYPFKSQTEKFGWAQTPYTPSKAQLNYLKKYGFKNIGSVIYGENAFNLLRDMMSPEWVGNYSSISD